MATYTTVSRVVLINSSFSHRCGVDRELGRVQEFSQFLLDTVTDGASIDEDSNITIGLLYQLVNTLYNGILDFWVVLRWLSVERGVKPHGGDLLIRHIGGESEIHRSSLRESGPTSTDRALEKGHHNVLK